MAQHGVYMNDTERFVPGVATARWYEADKTHLTRMERFSGYAQTLARDAALGSLYVGLVFGANYAVQAAVDKTPVVATTLETLLK